MDFFLLACAGIVSITGAISGTYGVYKIIIKPVFEKRDKRVEVLEKKHEELEKRHQDEMAKLTDEVKKNGLCLEKDRRAFESQELVNMITIKSLNALLRHALDNNHTEQMKDCSIEIEEYLFEKGTKL